ncbi:MAG: hypothetical protein Q9161_006288 [Pseudevernia consocians]
MERDLGEKRQSETRKAPKSDSKARGMRGKLWRERAPLFVYVFIAIIEATDRKAEQDAGYNTLAAKSWLLKRKAKTAVETTEVPPVRLSPSLPPGLPTNHDPYSLTGLKLMAIITEKVGDIFSAPPKSILIHACNARGAWGSGVAVAFKQKYPYAFRKYNAHCLSPPKGSALSVKQHQANLVGTTFLIPPLKATNQRQASKTPHYIACLFTSFDYGKKVSPPEEILENTRNALGDLAKQVAEMRGLGEELGDCHAVRINSGRFGVDWQKTKAVLEAGDTDITVVRPEAEEKADGTDVSAGGKLGQPPVKGEEAKGEKPRAGINARGYNRWASVRTKAESPLDKQMHGVKRKVEKDSHADGDDDREDIKGKEQAQVRPRIAKRRMKLGLLHG